MSSAAISAFLAGVSFLLPLTVPMLRPAEPTLVRSMLVALLCIASGGVLAFAILLLGGTPRPMSDTNWWLYRSGLVFGFAVAYSLGYRYGRRRAEDPNRFIGGILVGIVLGTVFHWIAPAGTDTYAVVIWLAAIGGVFGFFWELHFRKQTKRGTEN